MMLTRIRDFIRPMLPALMLLVLLAGAVTSGLLELVSPGAGVRFTVGVAGWFRAIPTEFYALLGTGYVTYSAARSHDKARTAGEPEFDAGVKTP